MASGASHPPTPEQAEILDAVSADGSVLVEAGAGVGKTTMLEMSATRIRQPALAVAFNKRIADEMAKRLPGNFASKTMNALGHGAWSRAIDRSLKVDTHKAGKLVTEAARGRRMDLSSAQWDAARGLLREAQIQGLVPNAEGPSFIPDTLEGWESLLRASSAPDIDSDDFEYVWEIAREALLADIVLARQGIVSFDDQIYCSTMLMDRRGKPVEFARYPVIFLDEDQDLNPLQIEMVAKSTRSDTKLLAVGDRCQSIYAFRGAVGQAAEQLRCLRPAASWTDLPLMTSFRVPQLVAVRQRDHVPLFRAHGANPTGIVKVFGKEHGWSWASILDTLPDSSMEVAILCRNNAPLLSLAFKLIRQGIGCYVLGRDISRGLIALSKKIAPEDSTTAEAVRGLLAAWQTTELSKAEVNDKPELADRITDRVQCILAVLEGAECRDAGQLRRQLERLFSRDSGQIVLSTIHKAKGLEWPAVIHLDPWRIPSKWAKGNPRALEQEANLRYVAETRTKHTLILASLDDFF